MKDREKKELIRLLKDFILDLDCGGDCETCNFGVLNQPNYEFSQKLDELNENYTCPLDVAEELINLKFNFPKMWLRVHS